MFFAGICLSTGGCAWSREGGEVGVPGRGVPGLGGVWSWEVPGPGGGLPKILESDIHNQRKHNRKHGDFIAPFITPS